MTIFSLRAVASFAILGLLPVLLDTAIFIRHDVDDDNYQRLAKELRFRSVASVKSDDKVIGSCVLIHEQWVITDAHVLKDVDLTTVTIELGNEKYQAKKKVVHPDYEAAKFADDVSAVVRKGIDLALVQLKEQVKHIQPVKRASQDVKIGTKVFLCGYGSWGTADDLQTKTGPGVKRAGTNIIDAIGFDEGRARVPKIYYIFDMDSIEGDRNKTGDADPTELEAVATGGDSGGGVFADIDGQWSLAGIFATARYDTSQDVFKAYGTLNFVTRISEVSSWIDETLGKESSKGG